jgi:hypothetical protein
MAMTNADEQALQGAGDFAATELPSDGKLIDSTLGYFMRPGGHSLTRDDWKAFMDFADKRLGPPANPRSTSSVSKSLGAAAGQPKERNVAPVEVPRWEMHEFTVRGRNFAGNPFRDAVLAGEFTAPSGKTNTIEGFYDGEDTWQLRFAPDEEGIWRYRLRCESVGIFQEGQFRCTAPRGPALTPARASRLAVPRSTVR